MKTNLIYQNQFSDAECDWIINESEKTYHGGVTCLLYTSPSPRDGLLSRMPSSA